MLNISSELHSLFNQLERYSYPFNGDLNKIPQNGIYVKFENGEKFGKLDRIVRIGTDTGENQLHSRLSQHYENKNQRRSIFRKNIGRCILKKQNNEYLKFWDLDITSKIDKEKNLRFIDIKFENQIEEQISEYIQNNFTFCAFRMDSKEERLFWERKIIATIAQSNIKPSQNWLGNYSTKEKIRIYGLWQIQGLKKQAMTQKEFEELISIVSKL